MMLLSNTNRTSLNETNVTLLRGSVVAGDCAHRSSSPSKHGRTLKMCAGVPALPDAMPRFAVAPAVIARSAYAASIYRGISRPASRLRQVPVEQTPPVTGAAGSLWAALVLSRLGRS
jgi:hypothetical protein